MIIVADTSALYAAFDGSHPDHIGSAQVVHNDRLALSPLVLTELDYLVHRDLGFDAALQVMQALQTRFTSGQYRLSEVKPGDLSIAHEIRAKYAALRLDLADVVGVVLADRYKTDRILTLDQRDFRAITPLTPGLSAFRILPNDS